MKQRYLAPNFRFVKMYGLDVLAASTNVESIGGAQSGLGETWFEDIYE